MPQVRLPDGHVRDVEMSATALDVAQSIGSRLAKATIAVEMDGALKDASTPITQDVSLKIITAKDEVALEVIRHSCAHLLAQAVQSVYPEAQVTIGPVIDDGFYYDFAFERPFTPEDLERFEQEMHRLAKKDLTVVRTLMSRDEAKAKFAAMGEAYKVEIIDSIPTNESLSFYQQGDFIDLCRGPHVPRTGVIKHFKLMKLAGAYWRGDPKNPMLQRIYGTAWLTQDDLEAYLFRLSEAEKRDHRKLGTKLDLFHMQDIAPGMVFWHPRGWTLYRVMQQYIRSHLERSGYQEVNTPQLVEHGLWVASGHWEKFRENMYALENEERIYALKPMNCPCHVQIYNQKLRSYRDLPLRLAEFGSCHRHEISGALHGLMRVRHFVQDDAHIFCTEDQMHAEVGAFIELLFKVYKDFGFKDILMRVATRPEQRVGQDAQWDRAEAALKEALNDKDLAWTLAEGEGAFYGPKIEFTLRDSLGRLWQCGTIQVDFAMPERLEASYIAEDGSKKTPVMLHRAILGTFERFMGIVLEEHAGALPFWLAPVQMVVLTITDQQHPYAQEVVRELEKAGFRVIADLRNEKIGYKIREHAIQRIPYLLVLGEQERQAKLLRVRNRNGDDLGACTINEWIERCQAEAATVHHDER